MMRPRGKRVRRRKRRRSRGLGNWFLPVSALCFLLAVCIMGFKPDASAQGDSTSLAKTAYQPNSSTQTNPDSATDTLKVIEQGASTQTDPNFFPLQPEPSVGAQQDPSSTSPEASGSPKTTTPDKDSWNLLLVNPWNPLPADYSLSLTELKNGLSVDSRCYPDLQAMMDACRADGLSPVICSAYRTQEYQEKLFQNKVDRLIAQGYSEADAPVEAGKSVAVPGTSEHQLGLAVDIVDINNQHLDETQESTAVQKWLMEHSWEYGFILRYPNDKSEITGIIYEPWHYRYVGHEDAEQIHSLGVCLEEYLEGAS